MAIMATMAQSYTAITMADMGVYTTYASLIPTSHFFDKCFHSLNGLKSYNFLSMTDSSSTNTNVVCEVASHLNLLKVKGKTTHQKMSLSTLENLEFV